ncbi:MAG: hypothetical protein KME31_10280 [Tolypothrix carrinoi HA7290-LM1]|jgi:hypothetical protein|nr:hypothetical protein [Tolypothrix carrinoi HA7290-LM1]
MSELKPKKVGVPTRSIRASRPPQPSRIDPVITPKTIVTVTQGKVLAEIQKNGITIESKEITAVGEYTFHVPNNSSTDVYKVVISSLAIRSEYQIHGNTTVL